MSFGNTPSATGTNPQNYPTATPASQFSGRTLVRFTPQGQNLPSTQALNLSFSSQIPQNMQQNIRNTVIQPLVNTGLIHISQNSIDHFFNSNAFTHQPPELQDAYVKRFAFGVQNFVLAFYSGTLTENEATQESILSSYNRASAKFNKCAEISRHNLLPPATIAKISEFDIKLTERLGVEATADQLIQKFLHPRFLIHTSRAQQIALIDELISHIPHGNTIQDQQLAQNITTNPVEVVFQYHIDNNLRQSVPGSENLATFLTQNGCRYSRDEFVSHFMTPDFVNKNPVEKQNIVTQYQTTIQNMLQRSNISPSLYTRPLDAARDEMNFLAFANFQQLITSHNSASSF